MQRLFENKNVQEIELAGKLQLSAGKTNFASVQTILQIMDPYSVIDGELNLNS